MTRAPIVIRALVPLLLAAAAPGQGAWSPGAYSENGTSGPVFAQAEWDNGSGPSLYAGGQFQTAGNAFASNLARWDGVRWTSLGGGTNGNVLALAVFDDGNGESLWVGGQFTSVDGQSSPYLARWNGTNWVGVGFDRPVYALAVFDDGTGPALFAAGTEFTFAGNMGRLARWTGVSWVTVVPTPGALYSLEVFDDGTGPALFVGGDWFVLDPTPSPVLGRFDGAAWSTVYAEPGRSIRALETWDDGNGPDLYIGGDLPPGTGNLVRWNGSTASTLGLGLNDRPRALLASGNGSGSYLYAAGDFTTAGGQPASRVARFDGTAWQGLQSGVSVPFLNSVSGYSLGRADLGNGPAIYVGGYFLQAGSVAARNLARWDITWNLVGFDRAVDGDVAALFTVTGSGADILYAAGTFQNASGTAVNQVARFDGSGWVDLAGGLSGGNGSAFVSQEWALGSFDGGLGTDLVVAGNFTSAGGVGGFNNVATWNGTAWSPLGSGVQGTGFGEPVECMVVHDDGTGPQLYVGGTFAMAGGIAASNVARWNGSSWSAVGGGLGSAQGIGWIADLAVLNEGAGPRLFAGAVGVTAGDHLWSFDGTSWSSVAGTPYPVLELSVFDDGSGPALFFGQDGLLQRYQGGAVVPVPAPTTIVGVRPEASQVYDDGTGAALYLPILRDAPGTLLGYRHEMARFDGTNWTLLNADCDDSIEALTVFDDGTGPSLVAGGRFDRIGGGPAGKVGHWGPTSGPPLGLSLSQNGIGGGVTVQNANLTPGRLYANFVSFTPCAGPVGSGPWAGLCAPDPNTLLALLQAPLNATPFLFVAHDTTHVFGPYPGILAATVDVVLLDVTGGQIQESSRVRRFVIQ